MSMGKEMGKVVVERNRHSGSEVAQMSTGPGGKAIFAGSDAPEVYFPRDLKIPPDFYLIPCKILLSTTVRFSPCLSTLLQLKWRCLRMNSILLVAICWYFDN